MAKRGSDGQLRTLELAKAEGFIRYARLASILPRITPGDSALDQVLSILETTGLQVIADEQNQSSIARPFNMAFPYQSSEVSEDPLQVYVREVNRVPALSADRERELMGLLATDAHADVVKTELVESQLGLVLDIVRQYRQPVSLHILDVVQRGNEALLKAVNTFIAGRTYRFGTYVTVCVHQSLKELVEAT